VKKRLRLDDEVAAFLSAPAKHVLTMRVGRTAKESTVRVKYPFMELHNDCPGLEIVAEEPELPDDDTQEEWNGAGWVVRVPESGGSARRILLINYDAYHVLEEHQKGRCVYDTHMRMILYCPRDHLSGTHVKGGSCILFLYIANGVRYEKLTGEFQEFIDRSECDKL
jgi:hypothetical protein